MDALDRGGGGGNGAFSQLQSGCWWLRKRLGQGLGVTNRLVRRWGQTEGWGGVNCHSDTPFNCMPREGRRGCP